MALCLLLRRHSSSKPDTEIGLCCCEDEGRDFLSLKNLQSSSCCRICHEEELQNSNLEAPCACSGTAKFAHRECIQRWCDEKGNTTCEICLKEYIPGYTAAPKKVQVIKEVAAIRNLEIPIEEHAEGELPDNELPDCSVAHRIGSCCKTIALGFLLLLVH